MKEFATAWGIKSGKDGTLSSYGYTLLCAHFLQNAPLTGVDLPILPVRAAPEGSELILGKKLDVESYITDGSSPAAVLKGQHLETARAYRGYSSL